MIRWNCGIISLAVALLLGSAIAIPIGAQTGSVSLEGSVRDPSGNPLPDSVLTAVETDGGYQLEAVSDSEGQYRFPALPPGIYDVTAKAKGYKDVVHRRIFLFSPGSTVENFVFEVSAIDREIGPQQRARVREASTAASFSRREMNALPILNRNPLVLSAYQPGVDINGGNEGISTVNGTRLSMNTAYLDGLSIADPVDPNLGSSILTMNSDALSSIQIITAGGSAEYGRVGGAQTILVSRSGSKSWSGSIYDYFINEKLNANDYFNNKYGIPKPQYSRNMFGATASGPIGDKTRIFANFEANRTDQEVTRNRLVLTSTAKNGVFQWYAPDDTVRDEETSLSYDIAANDPRGLGIDPAIASIIADLPNPNNYYIGDGLNTGGYSFNNSAYFNQERIAARADRILNARHRLFVRFSYEHTDATDLLNNADASFPGQSSGTLTASNWGFALGSNYVFNPNMINELRIGYSRSDTDYHRSARSTDPMFLANSWTNPLDTSFPRSFASPIFEIADSFFYGINRHSLKFGFSFRRTLQSSVDYSGAYPNVTFGTSTGNAPLDSIGPSEQSEISSTDREAFENLYNDLLGRIESVSQTFYSGLNSMLPVGTGRDRNFAFQEYAGFIQDTWKIRRNLTLNLGLRYEIYTVPEEKNGLQGVLDQASKISETANISDFVIRPGDDWYSLDLNNFSPRIGFSWDPYGSGTFVLRGAYGFYYDRLIGGITNFVDRNSYGFSQTRSLYPNSGGTDVRLSDGIPLPQQPEAPDLQPSVTRSSSIAVLDSNLNTPRVDQFSLKLEKRLFGAILEAGYVGTRGKNLFQYLDLNQTKTGGDFLEAFRQLQEYREMGTPVPSTNTLARIFGSPLAAFNALGGSNFDSGQVGVAANTLDRSYYGDYAAAGVSDFYLRNFPQFDRFLYGTNAAESWYDSLQVGIRKSTNNYNVRAYYTWSKSLDTMSADGAEFISFADNLHPELDKAPSDLSRTHVLNAAFDYAIPFGRDPDSEFDIPKWANMALGGWNLGTLWIWESGQPFSVRSGLENRFGGVTSLANFSGNRGDIGNIVKADGYVYWIHPTYADQFSYPEAGEYPTSGRNSFTGPRYFNLDIMIHKNFTIREKYLNLRIEAYNLFNSTRFGLPNTNMQSPLFGIITSSRGAPRMLQLALRYQF